MGQLTRSNNRKFPGSHGARPDLHEQRKAESDERVKERSERSNHQQVALLDHRLGEGVGAKKERARLALPPKSTPGTKSR
jgi:hypothetical protein